MPPPEIQDKFIELPHKPGAKLACSLVTGTDPDAQKTTIVFLNGLVADKSSWRPVMASIIRQRKGTPAGYPTMLAYDRYGQGLTESRDPKDQGREQGHGHDCSDAAADVRQLILKVFDKDPQRLVLVGNSIGCAIARLYAALHPVAAILFLDSVMANSDFDVLPNPDAADFDKSQVPEDVTVEVLRQQRAKTLAIFSPAIANKEGLSRRNLPELLPWSDRPVLNSHGKKLWITVLGHDFETFAEETVRVSVSILDLR